MYCSKLGLPVHHQLLEFTQTHVHWVGDAIKPSHPLQSPSLLTFNLSQHQGLVQWVSSTHQVPRYWSFSFNISPSNEYSGLISYKMGWLDVLQSKRFWRIFSNTTVQKQQFLALNFLIVQLSHPYMTTGKTTALTRWTVVGKVMPLLFNMLSRLVIPFLPRSKCLLITWLQSPTSVILEPKIKWTNVSTVSPSTCHEVRGPDAMISFLNVEL